MDNNIYNLEEAKYSPELSTSIDAFIRDAINEIENSRSSPNSRSWYKTLLDPVSPKLKSPLSTSPAPTSTLSSPKYTNGAQKTLQTTSLSSSSLSPIFSSSKRQRYKERVSCKMGISLSPQKKPIQNMKWFKRSLDDIKMLKKQRDPKEEKYAALFRNEHFLKSKYKEAIARNFDSSKISSNFKERNSGDINHAMDDNEYLNKHALSIFDRPNERQERDQGTSPHVCEELPIDVKSKTFVPHSTSCSKNGTAFSFKRGNSFSNIDPSSIQNKKVNTGTESNSSKGKRSNGNVLVIAFQRMVMSKRQNEIENEKKWPSKMLTPRLNKSSKKGRLKQPPAITPDNVHIEL